MGKISQGQQHYMELFILLLVLRSRTNCCGLTKHGIHSHRRGRGITRCPCDVRVIVYINQQDCCSATPTRSENKFIVQKGLFYGPSQNGLTTTTYMIELNTCIKTLSVAHQGRFLRFSMKPTFSYSFQLYYAMMFPRTIKLQF